MISSTPRTLVFSQRHLSRRVYQCSNYEFEDVIGQVDSADLLAPGLPEETPLARLRWRAVNKARRSLNLLAGMTMTMNPVTVDRRYELFFAVFLFPAEVLYLNKVRGWREQAKHAACFLGEVWTSDRALLRQYSPLLRQFDHIFLHIGASLSLVESVIGRPCHLIRVGVDAIRFCPYPDPPPRVVDCYSFGRRSKPVHEALLKLSGERRFFYLYDTVSNFSVNDPAEHRRMTAEIIKRARYFIAFKHNLNASHLTGGDEAMGARHFEGTAGGAVMLGVAPATPEFNEVFNWEDALIPIPPDAQDMGPILAELDAQPERLERARRNNVVGALRRHDWGHRWGTILDVMGLPALPALAERKDRLEALARLAEGG